MRAAWCFLLVGCGFHHGGLQDTGGTKDGALDDVAKPVDSPTMASDAAPDGSPATACGTATPRVDEKFSAAPACPLGVSGGNATMGLNSGALQITTNTNSEYSYCNEADLGSWSGNGATVEVPNVMTGNNAWTSFQVLGPNFAMTVKNNALVFSDNTGATPYVSVVYNSTNMRWWRLRPDAGATNVIAEYSPDRVTWTMLGSHAGGGMIRVQMIAGTDGTASPSGVSRYDNLVVCP